ncbi:hypothetical protein BCR44DRAFT_1440888 [Catenaria anguillulae PL171]|uniref:Uncharacterized protein n=1 Tax=Catenaria anguillulae PL171 TaxID=765915 RepID=A0A1Y2HC56_9FUNG|nr:hypothetical protein BCR44DRAFT_1440888 [Catenaria anguillulae PL171]
MKRRPIVEPSSKCTYTLCWVPLDPPNIRLALRSRPRRGLHHTFGLIYVNTHQSSATKEPRLDAHESSDRCTYYNSKNRKMSASNATDPLRTFSRLIALGGNVQNPPTSTNGLGEAIRASNGMALCQKLITRLTLEARTDPQGLSSVANGIGAHCSDSDRVIGINFLGKPRRLNDDLVPQVPMNTTLAQVAGPDAMDGIKDLTVGMGTVVNSTATGEAKERFAIVSLGYAGKELKLDGLAAGNSSASRANATAVSILHFRQYASISVLSAVQTVASD